MAFLHFQKDACSLMHTGILTRHMSMLHTHAVFSRARGGIRSLETGVTDGCVLLAAASSLQSQPLSWEQPFLFR